MILFMGVLYCGLKFAAVKHLTILIDRCALEYPPSTFGEHALPQAWELCSLYSLYSQSVY